MNASARRPARQFYEFGPFRLDATEKVLLRDGAVIPLKPKVFETLLVLVESGGHVIERDELMKTLWPDTVVEENNLNQYISALRRALGEGEGQDQYIETLPRRGYRFVAEVRESRDEPAGLVLEKHTLASIVIEQEREKESADNSLVPSLLERVNAKAIAASILLGTLIVAGYFLIAARSRPPEAVSAVKSIAVLPFKPLSTDANDEYMGLGMTDALITRLGAVSQIVVRSTSAVRKYTVAEQDPAAVGRELKVETVLDGSIQRVGERVRLTLQLVRVGDGKQLWTDKFDAKFTDLLTLEDSISERVAAALALKLTGEERKELAKRYTESGEAYILYLRGRYFWNKRTLDAVNKAIEYFQQAVEKDSNYALAYAGIADSYVLQGGFFYSAPPADLYPKAKDAAIKALAIDDQLAEAHTSLAMVKTQYDWQWADAESEFKEAIALKPNYPTAHHWYGFFLVSMRRFDEAVAEIKRAQELDPVSLIIGTDVGAILFMARRDDQAIEQCRKTLELDPNFIQAHNILALIYSHGRMYDQWLAEREKALTLSGNGEGAASLARLYAQSGYRGVMEDRLAKLKQQAKSQYVQAFAMALAYAQLGDNDRAFEWLEKAYQERSPRMSDIKVTPALESLRADSRFPALVRRIGLEP